jgi:hypothetical protein
LIRVSSTDRDLDKRVITIPHRLQHSRFYSPNPPFHLQLQVHRTCFVPPEAEFESVFQMFQSKTIRTSLIRAIKKWTMRYRGIQAHASNHRRSSAQGMIDPEGERAAHELFIMGRR